MHDHTLKSFKERMVVWAVILLPLCALIAGLIFLPPNFFVFCVAVLFVVISGLGITVGYHRLFTHAGFETYPAIKYLLVVCGSMALEGRADIWVANHHIHHLHSDEEGDPHSPVHGRKGFLQRIFGAWHAHCGWLLHSDDPADLERFSRKLLEDPVVRHANRLFVLWAALGLLIPTAICGLESMSWMGALQGFVWAGVVRILFVHHVTWSINSLCHMVGSQPHKSGDNSRNNWFLGIITFGESFHNTHHAYPQSARHGLHWWELDPSWWTIKILESFGLLWNIKLPTKRQLETKKIAA